MIGPWRGIVLSFVCVGLVACGIEKPADPGAPTPSPKKELPPNVLLITIDTTRADHVGAYGYDGVKTPNMDALAAEGVLFEEAFAVQPVTLPAHASILTGKYPFRHGVRDNNIYKLSEKNETLAEVLSQKGYVTTAFVAATVLNHRFGLNQGFRYYNDRFVKPKQKGRLPVDRRAQEVSFLAREWLDELKGELAESPFFLWLHYYDPHADYDPPHPYKTAYANPYDGEIAYLDDWLGYVFEDLKTRGMWDRTMVVLVGDHGEGFGDHGENTHGMFIYRATTHVPLIVKMPGGEFAGTRVPHRVSQVDIVPTVYAVLDAKGTDEIDGRSLLPLMEKRETGHRSTYSEVFIPRSFNWSDLKGLRQGDGFFIDAPRQEFYDIANGAMETENLLEKQPDDAARVESDLAKLVDSAEPVAAEGVVLSDEMAAQLEKLGYFIGTDKPFDVDGGENLPDPKDRVQIFNAQQRANSLMENGHEARALAEYEKLVDGDPDNPRFLLEQAGLYVKLGEWKKAEAAFARAIEIDDRNARAFSLLGSMYRLQGRNADAAAQFEQAIARNPEDFVSLFHLATALIAQKEYKRARELLEVAVKRKPDPAALNNLGYVLIVGEGRVQEGIVYIQKAVKAARDKAPYLASLGSAYHRAGRNEKAAQALERALALVPDSLPVIEQLTKVYRAMDNKEGLARLASRKKELQRGY